MQRRLITATGNVVFLLCLMYLITYIDRVNLSTAAPLIRREFGLSQTLMGVVFSAFGYPYAVFQIIGGALGDHFGARRTLTICGIVWAIATILTGLTGGVVTLFLARLLLGIGEGATFPTATRAMQYWVSSGRRGFAQGLTHAFARAGNAIAPPLVVGLIAVVAWRGAFMVALAGVVGDTLGGVVSDRILRRSGRVLLARRSVVLLSYIATAACLVPVVYLRGLVPVTICLALGFFFLELAIGPMWAIPMDIAPKFSGTASGLMNFGSAVAAIVSPITFGIIVDRTGDWHLPFWGSVGILGLGCITCFFMRPDRQLSEQEVTGARALTAA